MVSAVPATSEVEAWVEAFREGWAAPWERPGASASTPQTSEGSGRTPQTSEGSARTPQTSQASASTPHRRDADQFADHFDRWLAPDIRLIQPMGRPLVGLRAFREQFVRPLFELIPDLHGTVEGWAASGETIYIELSLHGTLGRRPVTLRTVDRITLRDGVAVERVAHLDPTPLLAAIALTPRAWPRMIRQQLSAWRRPS